MFFIWFIFVSFRSTTSSWCMKNVSWMLPVMFATSWIRSQPFPCLLCIWTDVVISHRAFQCIAWHRSSEFCRFTHLFTCSREPSPNCKVQWERAKQRKIKYYLYPEEEKNFWRCIAICKMQHFKEKSILKQKLPNNSLNSDTHEKIAARWILHCGLLMLMSLLISQPLKCTDFSW